MTNSSSPPSTVENQVSGAKKMRGQNMNNTYSTYSRGYREIQPSPDPPHPCSSSLVTPTRPETKTTKSYSPPSTSTTVTAVAQPGRDLIKEQTTLRRRFRNQVSKAIGNNSLLADTGSISRKEEKEGGGRGKSNTNDPDTPVCPFTQDELDAKYRDAIQTYLQEHYSSPEVISTILEKSVRHFQWCCALWDFVPARNNTVDDSSSPQKEVSRLVKELKQLEKEHRSTLSKAGDTGSDRNSLSRLQTPALSICSSAVSSAVSSPALTFSTPPTPAPNFELDGTYTLEQFGSTEQSNLNFDARTDSESRRDEEKIKDQVLTKDKASIKDKKPTKDQNKDRAKDATKVKVGEGKEMTEVKAKENIKGKAKRNTKENTKEKVEESAKGKSEETMMGKAKDPLAGKKLPESDARIFRKGGGGDTSKAVKISTPDKKSGESEEKDQRDVLTKQGPITDASQKSVTQGINKKTLKDSAPQDQPPALVTASPVRNDGKVTQSFENRPRPPKRPLDNDNSSTSLSAQDGQPSRKRKL
ncbi:hypothetical protein BG000_004609 [Podila horticola]|nr:hypothetical protein BG000_004609 [Podila horticola]